jgi:hypothetical protein
VPGLRALCGWGRCNLYIAHVIHDNDYHV